MANSAWIDELDDDFFQAMQESGEVDNVEKLQSPVIIVALKLRIG